MADTPTPGEDVVRLREALTAIMRAAEAAKEDCGMDPETPAAIRNGRLATIAFMAAQGLGMVRGPSLAAAAPVVPQPADERAAFEEWAADQGFQLPHTISGDGYQDLRTQGPWDAWQARAALSASPTPPQG